MYTVSLVQSLLADLLVAIQSFVKWGTEYISDLSTVSCPTSGRAENEYKTSP